MLGLVALLPLVFGIGSVVRLIVSAWKSPESGWLSAWAAIVLAVVTAAALIYQVRQARFIATLDAFWHLVELFNGPEMLNKRRTVARALSKGNESSEIDDLLNFFNSVGYLVKKGAIDLKTVWINFSDDAIHYWLAAKAYVDKKRGGHSLYFQHYEGLYEKLLSLEEHALGKSRKEVTPSPDAVRKWLEAECRWEKVMGKPSTGSVDERGIAAALGAGAVIAILLLLGRTPKTSILMRLRPLR